jgi:hypothetical protein
VAIKVFGTTLADAYATKRKGRSIVMLPSWIVILSMIELIGLVTFALSIATAAPEEAVTRVGPRIQPGKDAVNFH